MEVRIIHNPDDLDEFLKNKVRYNYIYQFSDLSEKEWKNTICYGLYEGPEIKEIAVMSINYDIPVLLAASFENEKYSTQLIEKIKKFLPPELYTHIDAAVLKNIFPENDIFEVEEYMNMGLCDYNALHIKDSSEVVRLGYDNLDDIKELLSVSYPGAWLDDELVKLNENFGIYKDGKLISFAGIHAYSEEYQVAAVAHVTTHPEYRKMGYCEKVLSALLNDLKDKIKYIGLNVKVNNLSAVNCYRKLGFKEFGKFTACEIKNKV